MPELVLNIAYLITVAALFATILLGIRQLRQHADTLDLMYKSLDEFSVNAEKTYKLEVDEVIKLKQMMEADVVSIAEDARRIAALREKWEERLH